MIFCIADKNFSYVRVFEFDSLYYALSLYAVLWHLY